MRVYLRYFRIVTKNFIFSSLILNTYMKILQTAYDALPAYVLCMIVKV